MEKKNAIWNKDYWLGKTKQNKRFTFREGDEISEVCAEWSNQNLSQESYCILRSDKWHTSGDDIT